MVFLFKNIRGLCIWVGVNFKFWLINLMFVFFRVVVVLFMVVLMGLLQAIVMFCCCKSWVKLRIIFDLLLQGFKDLINKYWGELVIGMFLIRWIR